MTVKMDSIRLKLPVFALASAALACAPVAFADPPGRGGAASLPPGLAKQGKVPPGHAKKIWKRGEVLPVDYRDIIIFDYDDYHLRPAPSGYRWVRVDREAYLVEIATHVVADVIVDLILD